MDEHDEVAPEADEPAPAPPTVLQAPVKRTPWEQLDDEPDAAYARFLVYLELGQSRSVDGAYRAGNEAPKGTKKARASGQWKRDSAAFGWKARAKAWDISREQEVSDLARVATNELVGSLARRGIRMANDDSKPQSYRGALEILKELSFVVPKKTIIEGDEAAGVRGDGDPVAPKIYAR